MQLNSSLHDRKAVFRILNNGTLRKSIGSGQQFFKKKTNREVLVGYKWLAKQLFIKNEQVC